MPLWVVKLGPDGACINAVAVVPWSERRATGTCLMSIAILGPPRPVGTGVWRWKWRRAEAETHVMFVSCLSLWQGNAFESWESFMLYLICDNHKIDYQ